MATRTALFSLQTWAFCYFVNLVNTSLMSPLWTCQTLYPVERRESPLIDIKAST
jgi:hypothetical protein